MGGPGGAVMTPNSKRGYAKREFVIERDGEKKVRGQGGKSKQKEQTAKNW